MFLVIDGSSMLVTSYFAFLPNEIKFERDEEKKKEYYNKIMHNSKGEYTNAIYGMMSQLLKIIINQHPDQLAIVFDKSRNTFRRDLYADYKAQRKKTEDPLGEQFIAMENIIEKLGIACLYSDKYEADDLAGSITTKFGSPSCSMRFLTKDHDYLQLVNDYTRGWMIQTSKDVVQEMSDKYLQPYGVDISDFNLPDKVFEFTDSTVICEEGVMPSQIPDKKAICGDASDNIPGIKGIGEAAAVPLICEYGSLENILEAIKDCGGDEKAEKELAKSWKENLGVKRSPIKLFKENEKIGLLSKKLATIKTDCDIPEKLEDYNYEIDPSVLKEILERYEFNSLMDYVKEEPVTGGDER